MGTARVSKTVQQLHAVTVLVIMDVMGGPSRPNRGHESRKSIACLTNRSGYWYGTVAPTPPATIRM
jgi:hypothetical protein